MIVLKINLFLHHFSITVELMLHSITDNSFRGTFWLHVGPSREPVPGLFKHEELVSKQVRFEVRLP